MLDNNLSSRAGALQTIQWKSGTANDFFVSLAVLHEPAIFGVRPSWAAGVRQRIPGERREFLEKVQNFSGVPLHWLAGLPEPSDAQTALHIIEGMEPIQRMQTLTLGTEIPSLVRECLSNISKRGSWMESELKILKELYRRRDELLNQENLTLLVSCWAEAKKSGDLYLQALQDYYQVFFAEEETRIRPSLEAGLERARELAGRTNLDDLIEELSHGVHFAPLDSTKEFILAPSFWCAPLIFYTRLPESKMLLLFGARAEDESIVPGEGPSPQLVNILKALADPTRLRILRILADRPLSSSDLARRLRLRLPTVIHHLRLLRLSGLVHIIVGENDKRYATRLEILDGLQQNLGNFIRTND